MQKKFGKDRACDSADMLEMLRTNASVIYSGESVLPAYIIMTAEYRVVKG